LPTLDNVVGDAAPPDPNQKQRGKKRENPFFKRKSKMDKWCASELGINHADIFGNNEEGRKNLQDFRKIKVQHHSRNRKTSKTALCDRYTLGEECTDGYNCQYSHRLPSNFTHLMGAAEARKVDQYFDQFKGKNN